MSLNVGNVSASLTLNINGYTENLNTALVQMKGFIGDCTLLSVNLQNLGGAFVEAGSQSIKMNQQITEGIAALSAFQKSAYAEDLKSFSGLTAQKFALFSEGTEGMLQITNRLFSYFAQAYKSEYSNFAAYEKSKTTAFKAELTTRENNLNTSMQQMISVMQGYVGNFLTVGTEYGKALLSGIQSTKSAIMGYLDSIARAYRSVTEGANMPSRSDSGSGTYSSYSVRSAFAPENFKEHDNAVFSSSEPAESPLKSFGLVSGQILDINSAESINQAVASVGYANNFDYLYSVGKEEKFPNFDYDRLANAIATELASVIKPAVVYNPVYNSPKELSLSELKKQDTLNMRRLGFNF